MTIYTDNTGPLVHYADGILHIEDLNPEVSTNWRMSRWEMVKLGFKAIFAAIAA